MPGTCLHYGSKLLAVPALLQDGSQLSSEFFIVMLGDALGKVMGVTGADPADRWGAGKPLDTEPADCKNALP